MLRLHSSLNDVNKSHYVNVPLACDISTRNIKGTEEQKFTPLVHKRAIDELCFQCKAICHWNSLPTTLTALTNFTNFYTKAITVFYI